MLRILAFEETFGASGKIERSKSYLQETYPQLTFPIRVVSFSGNYPYSVDLNRDPEQHLEAYTESYSSTIDRIDVPVSSYTLEGTSAKLVNVILFYEPHREVKS